MGLCFSVFVSRATSFEQIYAAQGYINEAGVAQLSS